MQEFDLVPQLLEKGTVVESMDLRRYKDGRVLTSMPCAETVAREYGAPSMYAVFLSAPSTDVFNDIGLMISCLSVIHRADYYRILLDRAKLLGAEIRNRFRKMLSCIPAVLKWKLYHLPELSTWTNKVIIDLIESVRGSTPSPKCPFENNA
jgi:hypothetical protein